jgi:hypothetical protein
MVVAAPTNPNAAWIEARLPASANGDITRGSTVAVELHFVPGATIPWELELLQLQVLFNSAVLSNPSIQSGLMQADPDAPFNTIAGGISTILEEANGTFNSAGRIVTINFNVAAGTALGSLQNLVTINVLDAFGVMPGVGGMPVISLTSASPNTLDVRVVENVLPADKWDVEIDFAPDAVVGENQLVVHVEHNGTGVETVYLVMNVGGTGLAPIPYYVRLQVPAAGLTVNTNMFPLANPQISAWLVAAPTFDATALFNNNLAVATTNVAPN